jgi:RNA polymerase sigma-70 factor (ECF subfamily)
LGNTSDAEDLTQQTFERAIKAWRRFDPDRAAPRTWLLAIARNLVIDHLRRDRSRLQVPIGEHGIREADLPAAEPELGSALSAELTDAFKALSARDREVVALRFGGDLRAAEIASILDLKLANVQQILSRSLRKLRAELEGGAGRPPEGRQGAAEASAGRKRPSAG